MTEKSFCEVYIDTGSFFLLMDRSSGVDTWVPHPVCDSKCVQCEIPGRDFLTGAHFSDLSPATKCRLGVDAGRPCSCHLTLPHNSTRSSATWGSYVYAVRCVFTSDGTHQIEGLSGRKRIYMDCR